MVNIQQVFDTAAADYDGLRRILIPCFDDFYSTAVSVVPFERTAPLTVLDLGAETGIYAATIQAVFPQADITLLDLAPEMLEKARARFAGMNKSPRILTGDYIQTDFAGSYDLIISALSIHHLEDTDKEHLYQRIYSSLKPSGMFINADQVLGSTTALEKLYRQNWLESVLTLGISEAELNAARQRMECDRMAPLNDQMRWLKAASFQDVDCWYKNFSFAVFGGHRPA